MLLIIVEALDAALYREETCQTLLKLDPAVSQQSCTVRIMHASIHTVKSGSGKIAVYSSFTYRVYPEA